MAHSPLRRWLPFATALLVSIGAAHASPYAWRYLPTTSVHAQWVYLNAGTTYTFQTSALSTGADPMMHLWGAVSGIEKEIARNDDSGGGTNPRITFLPSVTNWYRVIVRAKSASTAGTGSLLQNGVSIATGASFGGNPVPVYTGNYQYETALSAGGSVDTTLWGLNCSGQLVGFDFDSGVGLASRLQRTDLCTVVVAGTGTSGTHFYVNDAPQGDRDGDGLGTKLEAELRSCDATTDPGCTGIFNTKDSDRDGLSDPAELFGIDDATRPQYLPRWGATPTHKDVFVEIDYTNSFASNPFVGADAVYMQGLYNIGLAPDLKNLDGVNGIALHFDIGTDATVAAQRTLFGNWGGSNMSNNADYRVAPDDPANRAVVRRGVFHYALAGMGNGGGQGWRPGDRLGWGAQVANRFIDSLAHELGHNLNLEHHGHNNWGAVNCKPNYRSIMSYAGTSAFSLGQNVTTLDPSRMGEYDLISTTDTIPSYIGDNPYFFTTASRIVDWNRDGIYGDGYLGGT